jgi:ketosteroid isomerase-like protein
MAPPVHVTAVEKELAVNDELTATLMALEHERCRHIVSQDFSALKQLLSSQLVHTHTRGNQDTRETYLHYLSTIVEILDLRRDGLHLQWIGDGTAIMHGKQTNRVRLRGKTDEVQVQAQVIQVWTREADGYWRQVAFQATPLGAPPPAVPR